MKTKFVITAAVFTAICLVGICFAFSGRKENDFERAKLEIVLRKVGHQILLLNGDRTSPVLPIKQVQENEFQLTFQDSFSFQPDSLVRTIGHVFAQHDIADHYIVNILDCNEHKVVYGYAILGSNKNDIVACNGRNQPKNCYLVNIKFEEKTPSSTQKGIVLGGIPLILFVGLLTFRQVKSRKTDVPTNILNLGNTAFNPEKREIIISGMTTDLTPKENELLLIFAHSPNRVIERAHLQKLLWEDEGVIVGRSLDMFISKLRKKLEPDDCLQLINIHGKGYKLTVDLH